jgi:CheY-like chemotaxis protein
MRFKQTLLLVDDSDDDLFLLKSAFKKAQFDGFLPEVRNGHEAIEYLSGVGIYADRSLHPYPSVVLLDINMPLKSGFDVLDWIAAQPEWKRTSVILFSASRRPEDIERAFRAGAHSYLVKPETIEKLNALVRCMLEWLEYDCFPPRHLPTH